MNTSKEAVWCVIVLAILSLMIISDSANAHDFNMKASDALILSKKTWDDTATFDSGEVHNKINDSMIAATFKGWSMVNVSVDNSCKWVLTKTGVVKKFKSLGYKIELQPRGNLECNVEISW